MYTHSYCTHISIVSSTEQQFVCTTLQCFEYLRMLEKSYYTKKRDAAHNSEGDHTGLQNNDASNNLTQYKHHMLHTVNLLLLS